MASPFPADQDARLVRFLEHDEIHVTAYRGLAYENSRVIWDLPPESGLEVARPLLKDNPDVDGLYMPCNKWRITPIIDQLGAGVRQARGDQHPGLDLDRAEGHGAEPTGGRIRQAAGSALAGETRPSCGRKENRRSSSLSSQGLYWPCSRRFSRLTRNSRQSPSCPSDPSNFDALPAGYQCHLHLRHLFLEPAVEGVDHEGLAAGVEVVGAGYDDAGAAFRSRRVVELVGVFTEIGRLDLSRGHQ